MNVDTFFRCNSISCLVTFLDTLRYLYVLWFTSRYFEVLLGTFRHFEVEKSIKAMIWVATTWSIQGFVNVCTFTLFAKVYLLKALKPWLIWYYKVFVVARLKFCNYLRNISKRTKAMIWVVSSSFNLKFCEFLYLFVCKN